MQAQVRQAPRLKVEFPKERLHGYSVETGWECQAVLLVPVATLAKVVHHANDAPIIQVLRKFETPAEAE